MASAAVGNSASKCVICRHAKREDVDRQILAGTSDVEVARRLGLPPVEVGRHRAPFAGSSHVRGSAAQTDEDGGDLEVLATIGAMAISSVAPSRMAPRKKPQPSKAPAQAPNEDDLARERARNVALRAEHERLLQERDRARLEQAMTSGEPLNEADLRALLVMTPLGQSIASAERRSRGLLGAPAEIQALIGLSPAGHNLLYQEQRQRLRERLHG